VIVGIFCPVALSELLGLLQNNSAAKGKASLEKGSLLLYNRVMTTLKIQQKNYNTGVGKYQIILPVNYEVIIPEDDSVRLLRQITEELDYTELYGAYSAEGRYPVTDPQILFQVMAYAHMEFIYSSRKIEKACYRDVNFMWLLAGEPIPDHTTISRFKKERLGVAMEGLFYQLVQKLCELGEVKYENVFLDGTKIEANANRYTFVWKKAVEKNEAKMLLKVQALAEEMEKLYLTAFAVNKDTVNEDAERMIVFLERKKHDEGIDFVYGSGKRKSNVQKLLEALYSYRVRQKGYDESNGTFDGRNSYSKTDKDATFMRMKDDHMKNGQLKPAYNIQLAVEAEYVVGVGIFPNPGDTTTLKPMLENMLRHSKNMVIRRLITDSGYESEENYTYLEGKGIECYIKPQTYEQQKKRSFNNNIGKRENLAYNPETDEYTCHNNKQLKPVGTFKKKSQTGYVSEVTAYECESCYGCPHKPKCTKAKGNKRMEVSKAFIASRQKSLENITTELGTKLRVNRSIQAEGAFGVLKEDRQFDRFLTRGKPNVTTEILLLCFGYNVNKLHAKIQNERCGIGLHEIKAA
jgi:transposase